MKQTNLLHFDLIGHILSGDPPPLFRLSFFLIVRRKILHLGHIDAAWRINTADRQISNHVGPR
jgi:hypothetical protein